MERYCVYVLSCADGTEYTGCTGNLKHRIEKHNAGKVLSTRYRLPVKVLTYIVFFDKYKAFFFEKYLKTGSGRAFLKKHLI